jgi:hypothetical protein
MNLVSLVRGFRNAYLRFHSNTNRVRNTFLRPMLKIAPIDTQKPLNYFLEAHWVEISYPMTRGCPNRNGMRFESI